MPWSTWPTPTPTTSTAVVALRIGYFAETRPEDDRPWPGERSAWLSTRDAAEPVRAAVEATNVDGSVVINGISANRYQFADLSEARALGYQPVDDAWAPVINPSVTHSSQSVGRQSL
ncbi:MAG TPA: hypothetical protein VK401_02405 [Propionibacteriaceae bacterium]|jgi:hypothetical protein|nr:hypothetical protein [Propionibacteriaceae bacterium]